jgi:hypothetical protein
LYLLIGIPASLQSGFSLTPAGTKTPGQVICNRRHALAFDGHDKAGFRGYLAVMASRFGVLCLSEKKDDLLQWSHYADRHKGICLGFDLGNGGKFAPVKYVADRFRFPTKLDEDFMWKLLSTKSLHWSYEKEWRVFLKTDTPTFDKSTGRALYFADFGSELILREVILGERNTDTAKDVRQALRGYSTLVKIRRMHLSCDKFELEERRAI